MVAATILEKAAVILLVLITIALSWLWYTRKELKSWMQETWFLVKQITPLLFAGVFLAGVISTSRDQKTSAPIRFHSKT